jgi:hypothetical protein
VVLEAYALGHTAAPESPFKAAPPLAGIAVFGAMAPNITWPGGSCVFATDVDDPAAHSDEAIG